MSKLNVLPNIIQIGNIIIAIKGKAKPGEEINSQSNTSFLMEPQKTKEQQHYCPNRKKQAKQKGLRKDLGLFSKDWKITINIVNKC